MTQQDSSWAAILSKAIEDRQKYATIDRETIDSVLDGYYRPLFSSWKEQVTTYEHDVICLAATKEKPDNYKELILETRAALRFGLCCCSLENDALRQSIQKCILNEFRWHEHLASILTTRTGKGDSKCRLLAAQLLSNSITGNSETALLVSSTLPISPSTETINSTIRNSLSNNDFEKDDTTTTTIEPTWVDMILSCAKSGNREALAAVVAALYNCIAALSDTTTTTTKDDYNMSFATEIASNSMLVSTLLRQFIAASALHASSSKNKNTNANDGDDDDDDEDTVWDSATEWIYLLVIKLASLGLLVQMYNSISSSSNNNNNNNNNNTVLPEHNVLLHCMAKEAESYAVGQTKQEKSTMPLGGGLLGTDGSNKTCAEIVDLLGRLWKSKEEGSQGEEDDGLRGSAVTCVLDVFAVILGVDSPLTSELRLHLGSHTTLLQDASKQLGLIVDDLKERSFGKKAREVKLSQEEQNFLTALVHLLGNMCFRCRFNQELMRTTLVPPATKKEDDTKTDSSRNALHILLSCTSYTTSCFTLREWSVIAIRNILENNTENQEVVARLDAQNPIQSAVLDSAGVRVNMDSKGNVSLTPLDEIEEVDN
jgi:hypothetical protein